MSTRFALRPQYTLAGALPGAFPSSWLGIVPVRLEICLLSTSVPLRRTLSIACHFVAKAGHNDLLAMYRMQSP